ncbi:SusF/SusE family outer membrane protein [Maribellus mangrovi]|uniref:SusF/SusE family outer membrane protein n=1 Tax=Maribellus mangrovi TaxID=3133146 RepID=UPI0030EC5690
MKRNRILTIFASLLVAIVLFSACTEDTADVRLEPTLSTANTLNVTSDSATVVGFVVAEGDGFTERGVCYSTSEGPTIDGNKTIYNEDSPNATFYVTLSGLNYATKYYARAYATGEAGTVYGEEVSFTTLPVVPFLTTAAITDITGNSAIGGGEVTGNGGASVSAYGLCFGTSENPTVADSKTTDGEGTGAFESMLSELHGNTTYYVRAYATSSAGTAYGQQVTFTTLVDLPKVTTAALNEITKTSAVSGGNVTDDGGADISARGLVWGLNPEPGTADNVIDGGTGTGEFVSNLTGLETNTTYYVRAFATNSTGTAFGEELSFTTLADITKFWVVGDYNGWDNSDNAEFILSTINSNGLAEGYVWLKQGGIKLVTDHTWDDAHTFGDDGSGGLTNPGNNISVPADGYYRIRANLSDMTYSLTETVWGVIGDATAGGWSDQTNMTYDTESLTFRIVTHLSEAGSFKFRGTSDWGINYGSDDNDGKLQQDGANIPVEVESDYAIVLDLSTPNEYSFIANCWGLIGDATPGGWDTDTDMTWDEENKVFTVTLDLTAASFKFRANNGWTVNLGGDLDNLVQDGENISVAEAGNYTITFDPWALKGTMTKN